MGLIDYNEIENVFFCSNLKVFPKYVTENSEKVIPKMGLIDYNEIENVFFCSNLKVFPKYVTENFSKKMLLLYKCLYTWLTHP